MISIEPHHIPTRNGHLLGATIFRSESVAKGAVLVVSAMGTGQEYYAPLANWLTTQGYCVVTFDYSGTGRSLGGNLRQFKGDIVDWARFDCDAMLEMASAAVPGKPVYWLGHSLGGQLLGLLPGTERIAKAITVASGSGYWRENAPPLKRKVWWLWYVVAPLAVRLCGYFPGRRLRKVGDLPRGVMDQWRRWCLNREYVVGVEGKAAAAQFAEVRVSITSLSFTDDEMMSLRNVESLHGCYKNAPRTMKRIEPAAIGTNRIGHFGFFKARFEQSLWHDLLLPELVTSI